MKMNTHMYIYTRTPMNFEMNRRTVKTPMESVFIFIAYERCILSSTAVTNSCISTSIYFFEPRFKPPRVSLACRTSTVVPCSHENPCTNIHHRRTSRAAKTCVSSKTPRTKRTRSTRTKEHLTAERSSLQSNHNVRPGGANVGISVSVSCRLEGIYPCTAVEVSCINHISLQHQTSVDQRGYNHQYRHNYVQRIHGHDKRRGIWVTLV